MKRMASRGVLVGDESGLPGEMFGAAPGNPSQGTGTAAQMTMANNYLPSISGVMSSSVQNPVLMGAGSVL